MVAVAATTDITRAVTVRVMAIVMAITGTITGAIGMLSHGGSALPLWRYHTMPIPITMTQNPSIQAGTTSSGVSTDTGRTIRARIRSGDMTASIIAVLAHTATE